jgi:peptide/nickel transport system substrate-binding protein
VVVKFFNKPWWLLGVVAVVGVTAVLVSAGGSSAKTSRTIGSGVSLAASTSRSVSGIKQTGPGLTVPTKGTGARIAGGTITFAEAPASPPNYIFPMYAPAYCGTNNIDDLDMLLYRPLYMYGNDYDPTVDYSDSIGQKPVYSHGRRTITIHLNDYMWSDGEQVSARDLVFWMNVLRADPAEEWCGYLPGKSFFPGNVVSYKAVNTTTFQMTLNKAYNPTWVQYNLLSQLTPMPIAWDRTSLSAKVPSPTQAHLPDTTKRGAQAVYNFLSNQGLEISHWAKSALWKVVDGPWKLTRAATSGGLTFVPNTSYSGPTKASISKFVEVSFGSGDQMLDRIKSEGSKGLSVAYLPAQDQALTGQMESLGYDVNKAAYYGVNFFPLNFNNPKVGPVFRQLYFRQAFQHLVDQNGWIKSFLHGTAVPTYGPVPLAPASTVMPGLSRVRNPYPFSVADAARLLRAHGWKVVPEGLTRCVRPGTGKGRCGKDIKRGEPIRFKLDYLADVQITAEEMQDLQTQASRVGIRITLTSHPFDDVYSSAVRCTPKQPQCAWTSENWGAGWIYGPDYLPTGEDLFAPNAVANYSNYSNATMDRLINKTITDSAAHEAANMNAFVRYAEKDLPVVWGPTSIGTFGASAGTLVDRKIGGYAANALGFVTPEDWYLTK